MDRAELISALAERLLVSHLESLFDLLAPSYFRAFGSVFATFWGLFDVFLLVFFLTAI